MKYLTSKDEFDAELEQAGNKLVVIDFTATWCGPCRTIAPEFEKLAAQIPDVIFVKVDVDEAAELSQHCGISCMPTFQFYKNKVKVAEITGADLGKLKSTVAANK
ncbi:unnamed protein product [Knipowitschia caucasica]|uniref:Thioredoxin n=1 Tax=Knipowitschia caucasica TaxID=637954 RepID=A0AAV2KPU6_KNICA